MIAKIRPFFQKNAAKLLLYLLTILSLVVSGNSYADDTQDLKKIVAIQQAQIAAPIKALADLDAKLSAAQAKSITDVDALSTRIDRKLDSGRDVGSGSCVISPTWGACPSGFSSIGNFYSCWNPEQSGGAQAIAPACSGAYTPRHFNVCCR